jgi:hypothetical protein
MRFLGTLLLTFSFSLANQSSAPDSASRLAPSPSPVAISQQEAFSHLIGPARPVYPRFALAAGLSGSVQVSLTVGADGFVYAATPVTHTPALLAAAQLWIAGIRFRPFVRDGEPVSVTTTLPVVFQLPPGTHSAHPLPVLYQRNVTSTIEREGPQNPPRARWSTLSAAMRDWLARYQAAVAYFDAQAVSQPFDDALAAQNDAPALTQMPGNIALYPISLAAPKHHLYLLFEFSHGCAKSNCPIFLLDESLAAVRIAITRIGVDVDLHRRRDSPYPDVLFWSDTDQTGLSSIAGYGYYGGEWGQLYCGTDDANEDSERDEEIADHRGARIAQPPLVTLCK